jgi:hypothetical protein
VLSNYSITNTGADFTINKRLATWTTQPNSKTYGDPEPNPLTTGSGSNFLPADGVTATYARAAGETVAGSPYHITATLSATVAYALNNYIITNAGADFTINKRLATWATAANSKTYGDPDPSPLTTGSGSNFVDPVSASYSRVAGESVAGNPYHITATLGAAEGVLDNYTITNGGADFTITKRNATWTTSGSSKTYGDTDPSPLTTGSGSNFVDPVSATYSRVSGESVGSYHITATLVAAAGALDNYIITNTGADFTINRKTASVSAVANFKIYGDPDPAVTTTNSGFLVGDVGMGKITFSASRAAGETVAGSPYLITPSASDSGTGLLSNYTVTYNTANFTINKRLATWTTNPASKTYGDADPSPLTTGSGTNFVAADGVSASYSRAAGETVAGSPYHITATLSATVVGALDNYTVTNNGADFTIKKAPLTVTVDPKTMVLNGSLPTLTGSIAGIKFSDNITATYSTTANGTAVGSFQITATLVDPGNKLPNYYVTNTPGTLTVSYAGVGMCDGDAGHQILQPVNADGTSTFKQGSTVPAKFRVCDANGISIGSSNVVSSFILFQMISGTITSTVDEVVVSTTPDTAFRWDPTGQQWIFNISTKPLATHATYVYQIKLNDGSSIMFQFGLPK